MHSYIDYTLIAPLPIEVTMSSVEVLSGQWIVVLIYWYILNVSWNTRLPEMWRSIDSLYFRWKYRQSTDLPHFRRPTFHPKSSLLASNKQSSFRWALTYINYQVCCCEYIDVSLPSVALLPSSTHSSKSSDRSFWWISSYRGNSVKMSINVLLASSTLGGIFMH